jgi:signal peptidase I
MGGPQADESGGSVAEHDRYAAAAAGVTAPAEPASAGPAPGEPAPADSPPYTRKPVKGRPLGCLIEIAETLILTIVIFWLIQTFVAQPFRVEQESMRTTLEPDQYVLVDKLTPRFDSYSRGDIVVFSPVQRDGSCSDPIGPDAIIDPTPYIKRVIGEPGDRVELREGEVLVNGVLVDEPYIRGVETHPLSEFEEWQVPEGRLFVMGDNRNNSTDSRSESIGMVCTNDVVGRAWMRYWPITTFGILQTPTYPNVPPAVSPGPALEETPVAR